MIFRLTVVLLATTLWTFAQSDEKTGTVGFLILNRSGRSLPGWKVTTFRSNDKDLASQFSGLTAHGVPTGVYRYVLTGPAVSRGSIASAWTPTLGGQVDVFKPERFVVRTATDDVLIGAAIDRSAPPFSFAIKGRLDPPPVQIANGEAIRINIHSLVPPWSDIDVAVDSSGDFRIFDDLHGLWVLTVVRGPVVLHVESVFFAQQRRPASLILTIGDKPLSPQRVE